MRNQHGFPCPRCWVSDGGAGSSCSSLASQNILTSTASFSPPVMELTPCKPGSSWCLNTTEPSWPESSSSHVPSVPPQPFSSFKSQPFQEISRPFQVPKFVGSFFWVPKASVSCTSPLTSLLEAGSWKPGLLGRAQCRHLARKKWSIILHWLLDSISTQGVEGEIQINLGPSLNYISLRTGPARFTFRSSPIEPEVA